MRNILMLVRREVEDHVVHYVLSILIGCVAAVMLTVLSRTLDASGKPAFRDWTFLWILGQLPCFMVIDAMALARVQMAGDRRAKVSAFICTLTPTRAHLLTAKWIAGLVWIGLGLCPLVIASFFIEGQPFIYAPFVKTVVVGVIVTLMCAYAMGQQLGLVESKGLILLVGGLFLCLLASLLVIKGLSMPGFTLLSVLAVALCVRSWWAFHHMAL